mmetsp:Transcript_25032/g.22751  ORF Transcript_25032/g.22751 Transcript_25032/m.22751 type:complete len:930 (+) Transcript_25032:137-2926(+)
MTEFNDIMESNINNQESSGNNEAVDPFVELMCKLIAICYRNEHRTKSLVFIESFINNHFLARCYPLKSASSNLCLPDERYHVLCLSYRLYYKSDWYISFINKLTKEINDNKNKNDIEINSITYELKSNKLLVSVIDQDISICFNELDDVYRTAVFEEINFIIGKDNLFKRSILLIKSWCSYESPRLLEFSTIKMSLIFEGVCILVMCLFATQDKSLMFKSPLDALISFLKEYSQLDLTKWYITPYGLLPKFDVSVSKGMPFPSLPRHQEDTIDNNSGDIDNHCQAFYEVILKYRLRLLRTTIVSDNKNRSNDEPDDDNEVQPPIDLIFVMDSLYPQRNLFKSGQDQFNSMFRSFKRGYEELVDKNQVPLFGLSNISSVVNKIFSHESSMKIDKSSISQFNGLLDTPAQYVDNILADAELVVKAMVTPDSLARCVSHLVLSEGRALTIDELQRNLPEVMQIPNLNSLINNNFGDFRRFISSYPAILQISEDTFKSPKVLPSPKPSPGSLWYYPSPLASSTTSESSFMQSFFGENSYDMLSSSSNAEESSSHELVRENTYDIDASSIGTRLSKVHGRPPRLDIYDSSGSLLKPQGSSKTSPSMTPSEHYFPNTNSITISTNSGSSGNSASTSVQSSRFPSPTAGRSSLYNGIVTDNSSESWHRVDKSPGILPRDYGSYDQSKVLSPGASIRSSSSSNSGYRDPKVVSGTASINQQYRKPTQISSNSSQRQYVTAASGATIVDPLSGTKMFNPVKPGVWVPGQFNKQASPSSSISSSSSSIDFQMTSPSGRPGYSLDNQNRQLVSQQRIQQQQQFISANNGPYLGSSNSSIAPSPVTKKLNEPYFDSRHTESQVQTQDIIHNQIVGNQYQVGIQNQYSNQSIRQYPIQNQYQNQNMNTGSQQSNRQNLNQTNNFGLSDDEWLQKLLDSQNKK